MSRGCRNSYILVIVVFVLVSSITNNCVLSNTSNGWSGNNSGLKDGNFGTRGSRDTIVGPLELLNNTDFSRVSDWVFVEVYNASYPLRHTKVGYDDYITPTEAHIINDEIIEVQETPFIFKSRINQTFWKPCWTSNASKSALLSFDYKFSGDIILNLDFMPVIDGDILVELKNKKTGIWSVWPIEYGSGTSKYGNGSFTTNDSRKNILQFITRDISSSTSFFNGPNVTDIFDITAPGYYEISIIFQLSTVIIAAVDVTTQFNLIIDNVSLQITDNKSPLVISPENKFVFGPYNNASVNNDTGLINIDFLAGGNGNTPLNLGSYRRNIGPGPWYQIFNVSMARAYLQNWSIKEDWINFTEGKNLLDIYCRDQVGNINDSVKINVIKDTRNPITNASPLEDYYSTTDIDIFYSATDPGIEVNSSGGFNNSVKLLFKHEDMTVFKNYTPSWNPYGFFNQSPINFNKSAAGSGHCEGKYEFYTVGIDIASNIESPPIKPDAITVIDYTPPTSSAQQLPEYTLTRTFDVHYHSEDIVSGMDYVELYYQFNGTWKKWLGNNGENGKFNQSPINFTAESDGIYHFYTVGYDNASNIELYGVPLEATTPDASTYVDTSDPIPIFIKPEKKYIKGTETITVVSDADTEYMEFYFWLDEDGDCIDDNNDSNTTWIKISNISRKISNDPPINWSIEWNTLYYNELKDSENQVILKAIGVDRTNKRGAGYLCPLEVDNKPPDVQITNPLPNTVENGLDIYINYTTDKDVMKVNIYYKILDRDKEWTVIIRDLAHPYGFTNGSYYMQIAESLRIMSPEVDFKVEAIDDAGNIGHSNTLFYINRQICTPKGVPNPIIWYEDFGQKIQKMTDFECHSESNYKNDDLKWYVTGNSGKLFHITGDNSTGKNADTFVFTSLPNKYGAEELTYHLYDPQGLEATIRQTIIVQPVNDQPVLDLPTEPVHIKYGTADTFDISMYVSDVDNKKSELDVQSLVDTEHISEAGLNLTFQYTDDTDGNTKCIKLKVSDFVDSTYGCLGIFISDNSRPRWIKMFPNDLELTYGESSEDVFDLDDHFSDPDDDELIFTVESDDLRINIDSENKVTLESVLNLEKRCKVVFRAVDNLGGWCHGYLWITNFNKNEPPLIKDIPDLVIHYYSETIKNYHGYGYDFSYFINDPDSELSELDIWVIDVLDDSKDEWISRDKNNNMRLIFKFPFSTVGSKRPLYLYVNDPSSNSDHDPVYKLFNLTVIVDNWPVEQYMKIPTQLFRADQGLENAFNLWDYFHDQDGGTNFEIISRNDKEIVAEIDSDFNVDLSCQDPYFEGEEELVIIAYDLNPKHDVYSVVKVLVEPKPTKTYSPLPQINITSGEQITVDILDYNLDIDLLNRNIYISTSDPDHVQIKGSVLLIKYDRAGSYCIKLYIKESGTSRNEILDLIINVEPKEDETDDDNDNGITSFTGYNLMIILILTIILILLLLIFLFKRSKKGKSKTMENGKSKQDSQQKNVNTLSRVPVQNFSYQRQNYTNEHSNEFSNSQPQFGKTLSDQHGPSNNINRQNQPSSVQNQSQYRMAQPVKQPQIKK